MTNHRPLPDEIYMRRRVGALVVLLLVVALVIWGLTAWARAGSDGSGSGGGSGAGGASATATVTSTEPAPVTSPTVSVSGESTASETAGASDGAEPSEGAADASGASASGEPTPSEGVVAKGSCELSDLVITAWTKQPSYGAGETPELVMTVKNPTDTDCVIDVGDDQLRFEVYSMGSNERVWADTDCYPSVETGVQKFPAGEERGFDARWSKKGSAPGQCANRQPVGPGAYYLHAVIIDNASDPAPFNLT